MIDIKFRAWDTDESQWYYSSELGLEAFFHYAVTLGHDVFQWTGLKDKNDIDIFEEDIVEVAEDCKTHGRVQDDGSTLWNVIYKGLKFEVYRNTMRPSIDLMPIGESEEVDIETVDLWLWNSDGGSKCLKVIGNTYENKELVR